MSHLYINLFSWQYWHGKWRLTPYFFVRCYASVVSIFSVGFSTSTYTNSVTKSGNLDNWCDNYLLCLLVIDYDLYNFSFGIWNLTEVSGPSWSFGIFIIILLAYLFMNIRYFLFVSSVIVLGNIQLKTLLVVANYYKQ